MKKIILVLLLFLALSVNVQAQLLKIGLKAGINYANFTDTEIQTSAITSYHAGIFTEIKIGNVFALQPELLYSTQGATYKTALEDFKNELGYISIPVLAKIFLGKSLSLELGPQASFLLNEKSEFNPIDSNTFDFAAAGGLGYKITKNIFIQGRYVLGLTEISKNAEAKNAVVQFSAGIMF